MMSMGLKKQTNKNNLTRCFPDSWELRLFMLLFLILWICHNTGGKNCRLLFWLPTYSQGWINRQWWIFFPYSCQVISQNYIYPLNRQLATYPHLHIPTHKKKRWKLCEKTHTGINPTPCAGKLFPVAVQDETGKIRLTIKLSVEPVTCKILRRTLCFSSKDTKPSETKRCKHFNTLWWSRLKGNNRPSHVWGN